MLATTSSPRRNEVKGLILKLGVYYDRGAGFWYDRLFEPVFAELDRLWWRVAAPAWSMPRADDGVLFPPGSASTFSNWLQGDQMELWGYGSPNDEVVHYKLPRVWLAYQEHRCWEIYTQLSDVLDRLRDNLAGSHEVELFPSDSMRRRKRLQAAGLCNYGW